MVLTYFVSEADKPSHKISGIDITRSGSGYNFLVGTNYDANGMFNQEDFSIIAKYDFDFDRVHSEQRVCYAEDKGGSDPLFEADGEKVHFQWGQENYGYY